MFDGWPPQDQGCGAGIVVDGEKVGLGGEAALGAGEIADPRLGGHRKMFAQGRFQSRAEVLGGNSGGAHGQYPAYP